MTSIRPSRRYVRHVAIVAALALALVVSLLPALAMPVQAAPEQSMSYSGGGWYRVKQGDTLGEIARYFGVTVYELKQANHLSSSTIYVGQRLYIPEASSPTQAGCFSLYRVQRGDTFTQIARMHHMNTEALARANGIRDANHIYVGQRICIPHIYGEPSMGGHAGGGMHGEVYVVQRGDTLSEIAKMFRVPIRQLMELNHIDDPNRIYVGQRLHIM